MNNDIKETIAAAESEQDDGKLTPEEQKFLDLLDEDRPAPLEYDDSQDNSNADPDGYKSEPIRRSVLKIAVYIVCLVAVILGVYFFLPMPHKAKKPIEQCHSIDEVSPDFFADEHYGAMMRAAVESYFKGDFTRCIETIHPHLYEITKDRTTNESANDALSLYFHALRFANLSPSVRRKAIEALAMLSREEPDNAAWRVASMRIIYKELLDYRQIFERTKAIINEWRGLLLRCNEALAEINSLEQSQRKRIAAADDDYKPRLRNELVDILSLQCALYTSKWLLEGGEGKSSLPDDEGDRGVASREHAIRIAMDNDDDCGKFKESSTDLLEARNFIALTVKSQAGGLFNSYFWNGKKHSRITPLEKEIVNTNAKLRKLKR